MKRANACRKSKGRTGPIGIVGIIEKLRLRLGRTPDPEEVQEEARRDKSGDRRSRTRIVDGVEDDFGGTTVPLSEDNSQAPMGETAPASNEVSQNINSPAEIPMVSEKHNKDPMTAKSTSSELNEEDLDFASKDPLGKILLKQMAELQAVKGGDVQMVLDSLMSQIKTLRKNAEQVPAGVTESTANDPGNKRSLNSSAVHMSHTEPTSLDTHAAGPSQVSYPKNNLLRYRVRIVVYSKIFDHFQIVCISNLCTKSFVAFICLVYVCPTSCGNHAVRF